MAVYVILSQMHPQSFDEPGDFRELAEEVAAKVKEECPGVRWLDSYATMGSVDVVDIVESDDPKQVAKAAMIIRSLAQAETETMAAAPWKEFVASL